MPSLNLTQTDLNVQLRGKGLTDIMMFLPDKGIYFPSNAVTVNKTPLSYTSNIRSLIEFSRLPQANIATFENNSWLLDGRFISPSVSYGSGGDSYSGYITNDLTDDNGDYATDPIIGVTLALTAKVEYVSLKFVGAIESSYPKSVKIRTYNENNVLIREHTYDLTTVTGLPLFVAHLDDESVRRLEFELIGTQCPHRRIRLNKILFGKAEQVDPYYLQSWKLDDKVSLVADSIPTKTFEFNIINYEGDYDIDNPGTKKIPEQYKDTLVFFNYAIEQDGFYKYIPQKTFNLTDISTTSDGLVTFTCGSILDVLDATFDQDHYSGPRSVDTIMRQLLEFSDVSTDQCIVQGEFSGYGIDVPLPEEPVRDLIQKLAFSCGATLTVNDDNQIIFAKKNIRDVSNATRFMFHEPIPFESAALLLETPEAEALDHTTNITMNTYASHILENNSPEQIIGQQDYELGTIDIYTMTPTRIAYSPTAGSIYFDAQSLQEQHANPTPRAEEVCSQHAIVTVTWDDTLATVPIKLKVYGRKVETTKTLSKYAYSDTLILDSGLASGVPFNLKPDPHNPDNTTFYYTDWYGAKFKYTCKTRNEYLVHAGDIILLETQFSDGEPNRIGYVLRNSYSDTQDTGEMEVIIVGNT